MERPVNLERYNELEAMVFEKARWIMYDKKEFWIGTDVCKVLGLAPSSGYGRRGYQKHFDLLNDSERVTLPTNFGGQAHQRVMVDRWGVRALVWRALQMEANKYCLIQRGRERKTLGRPPYNIEPHVVPEWMQPVQPVE